jgi:hypothetical protein
MGLTSRKRFCNEIMRVFRQCLAERTDEVTHEVVYGLAKKKEAHLSILFHILPNAQAAGRNREEGCLVLSTMSFGKGERVAHIANDKMLVIFSLLGEALDSVNKST